MFVKPNQLLLNLTPIFFFLDLNEHTAYSIKVNFILIQECTDEISRNIQERYKIILLNASLMVSLGTIIRSVLIQIQHSFFGRGGGC